MENIQNEIVEILKKYTFNNSVWENYNIETKIIADLKINSARIVDIIIDIEEKYDITIEDEVLDKIITINDIAKIIYNKTIS